MNITPHNVEAWLLDYSEGRLKAEQVAQLMLFLENHPELGLSLDDLDEEIPAFEVNNITMPGKDFLKQPDYGQGISAINIDDHLIAETEGLLDQHVINELNAFIEQHPEWQKDRKLYAMTHVQADADVVFEDKDALRKSRRILPYWSYAAAAVVIMAVTLMVPRTTGPDADQPLAETKTPAGRNAVEKTEDNIAPVTEVPGQVQTDNPVANPLRTAEKHVTEKQANQNPIKTPDTTKDKPEVISAPNPVTDQNHMPDPIIATDPEPVLADAGVIKQTPEPELTPPSEDVAMSAALPQSEEVPSGVMSTLGLMAKKTILNRKDEKDGHIDGADVTEALALGAGKLLGKKVDVERGNADNGQSNSFSLRIGKFGFSRIKASESSL